MRETTLNMFRITLNHCSEPFFFLVLIRPCILLYVCVSISNECLQMYIGINLRSHLSI